MNNSRNKTAKNAWTRGILVVTGSIFVGLGVIGIFIPLLPTTPFLLLAAVCYARGSERFYNWLIGNKWLGNYIRNYREGKGTPLRVKTASIFLLWLTIGYSVIFIIDILIIRIILLAIALGVTIHLIRIPTLKYNDD